VVVSEGVVVAAILVEEVKEQVGQPEARMEDSEAASEVVVSGVAVGKVAMRYPRLHHGKTCRPGSHNVSNGASAACTN
jgi:hypothetical protein